MSHVISCVLILTSGMQTASLILLSFLPLIRGGFRCLKSDPFLHLSLHPSLGLSSNMFDHRNFSLPLTSCPPFHLPTTFSRQPQQEHRGTCWTNEKSPRLPNNFFQPSLPSRSRSLYALSPNGLQSPVSDQSGASVTCSCVYCQHRPVLGQLGEQEKARQ